MPTKRRFLLFLIVLAIMLLIKHAVGQEGEATIRWDPDQLWSCGPNIARDSIVAWILGSITGVVVGFIRASRNLNSPTRSDLILLKLLEPSPPLRASAV